MSYSSDLSQVKRAKLWLEDSNPEIEEVFSVIGKLEKTLSTRPLVQREDCSNTIKSLYEYIRLKKVVNDSQDEPGLKSSVSDSGSDHICSSNHTSHHKLKDEGNHSPFTESSLSYELDQSVRSLSGQEKQSAFEALKSKFGHM